MSKYLEVGQSVIIIDKSFQGIGCKSKPVSVVIKYTGNIS